jgi:hypothetical protein
MKQFNTWGPITVLAVAIAILLVAGGLITVIVTADNTNPYTFKAFLDDLKYLAAALAAGAGIGRGLQPADRTT